MDNITDTLSKCCFGRVSRFGLCSRCGGDFEAAGADEVEAFESLKRGLKDKLPVTDLDIERSLDALQEANNRNEMKRAFPKGTHTHHTQNK